MEACSIPALICIAGSQQKIKNKNESHGCYIHAIYPLKRGGLKEKCGVNFCINNYSHDDSYLLTKLALLLYGGPYWLYENKLSDPV